MSDDIWHGQSNGLASLTHSGMNENENENKNENENEIELAVGLGRLNVGEDTLFFEFLSERNLASKHTAPKRFPK